MNKEISKLYIRDKFELELSSMMIYVKHIKQLPAADSGKKS